MHDCVLVTGGAGFIGSHFVARLLRDGGIAVMNLDKLSYAGSHGNLKAIGENARHRFVRGDICDPVLVRELLRQHLPRAIVHLAAETHVDRSIHGPSVFVQTNIVGTHVLLEAAREFWEALRGVERSAFRFVHVSTDEVYGSLEAGESPCDEDRGYRPNSPYAASKAAADYMVRAYHRTYGLPAIITNCSNNFGPYQHPEKLIPLVITHALRGDSIPIYGDGGHERDWLHVEDHCAALSTVLARGQPGETYNISASNHCDNLSLVRTICDLVDDADVAPGRRPSRDLITLVTDRPGHDRRYALSAAKIQRDLGWRPDTDFSSALRATVGWYLANADWVNTMCNEGGYRAWLRQNYADRCPP